METDMQQVEDQVQPDFYEKLTKLLDSANFGNKPELKKLIDKLRNIVNEQSSPAAEKRDIKGIYPVREYFLSSTGKRPSDKLYVHCPGLTPLLINTNKEALKCKKGELKQEAETWITSRNAQKLYEVVSKKLFYFGNIFCQKDIKNTTQNNFMPENQNVGCEINFMAYMLLEEEHEFINEALNTNSELVSLKITEFEALNMSFFHFAILMDSRKDGVVSECVDYMLQPDKNNELKELMKQAGNSKQQTHPTDEITSLALAIAFTSTNNTLIQKLIDVYENVTDSSFTNSLSEEFTYLLFKYFLATNVKQFEFVLSMFEPKQNSTETGTQIHAYKALTEKPDKLPPPHRSLLEHALLYVASDEVYKKIVEFLPKKYIAKVLMSFRNEGSCLFVRLAKNARYYYRLHHILDHWFKDSKGFDKEFDRASQQKIHREATRESLTQDIIILLNEFLDRFVVTNKKKGAHKCALVYYNLIDREGTENEDEHGRKKT